MIFIVITYVYIKDY